MANSAVLDCCSLAADPHAARRSAIDRALRDCLPRDGECPRRLAEAMFHAVFPGGKRVRPILTLLAAAACGSDESQAIVPACAIELVHCYSLVHDDLPCMDDDDLRRGRPTVHKAFDEATAVLAGDALLTVAFQLLADKLDDAEVAAACIVELARAAGAAGMVGGQADDLAGIHGDAADSPQFLRLKRLHERKTGALLLAAVRLGAIVAGADKPARIALDGFGSRIGLAFQIADDLLDVTGDETKLGKRARKDERRSKLTFPGLLGPSEAAHEAARLVDDACTAIEPLGTHAMPLRELARFVVQREH